MKNFLSELEKNLYDLKREVLKRNGEIRDPNTLVWMIDGMRNSVGKELLKTFNKVPPETPWDEIFQRTEDIWTYCNNCGWCDYINKLNRDEPCPICNGFDLKQRFVIVKIHCNKCGDIRYAAQGILKCVECGSKHVSIVRRMEVSRTVYGNLDSAEKIKTTGFKLWPKDKKGNLTFF